MTTDLWFILIAIPVAIGLVIAMRIDLVMHFFSDNDDTGRRFPAPKSDDTSADSTDSAEVDAEKKDPPSPSDS